MHKLFPAAGGLLFAASMIGFSVAAERGSPSIKNAAISSNSIALEFSEPMVTWAGSGLAPGISTEPAVACNWYWSDEVHLGCDADWRTSAIRPATRYRVAVHDGPWSQLGKQLADQVLLMESERPTLGAEISGWRDGRPLIEVTTNVQASADALNSVLALHLADGSPVAFTLRAAKGASYGERSKWRIELTEKPARVGVLTLHVNPGLRALDGELPGLQQQDLLHAVLDEPFALRLVGCSAWAEGWQNHASRVGNKDQVAIECPAGEQVSLEFSDAPTHAALAQLRSALPAGLRLEDKIEHAPSYYGSDTAIAARPGHFLRLTSERAGQSLSFDVPEALENDTGGHLDRAIHVTVDTRDFLPSLAIAPPKLLLPPGADAPAIFTGVNMRAARLLQRSLGGDARRTVRRTLDFGATNEKTVRRTPDPPRDVRDNGGFINGNTHGATEAAFHDSWSDYTIAYSAFNITASFADPQFLVWVTDWDHAGAIVGAKVELLRASIAGDVHVLASATTGEDGIATIDRPEEVGDPQHNGALILRATRDGRRAILPLIESLHSSRNTDREYHPNEIDERQQLAWGVTDKPLYRPGETVHYRVWLRQRQRNHLQIQARPASVNLVLDSLSQDHAIRRFEATPDAFGSVDGEMHLPDNTNADYYCIRLQHQWGWMTGACFRVTGYRTNDTWAELKADRALAGSGDTVILDASGGYYSGGPAVDAKAEIQSLLSPMQLQDAYPAFREFTFIDPYEGTEGVGGETFQHQVPNQARTDAQGHARIAVELSNSEMLGESRPIPFGTIEFTASVSPSPSNGAASAPVSMRFSRHPRFVGIKLPAGALRGDEDPRIETVVISAAGDATEQTPVHVVIDEVTSDLDGAAQASAPLAECDIVSGVATTCPFRAPHSGWYRFHASSAGAADAKLEHYAFVGGSHTPESVAAKLTIAAQNVRGGETTMLTLQQPFAHGRALFTIEHGGVLAHWVQEIDAPVVLVPLRVDAAWAPGATVHAAVLDASSTAFGSNASPGSLVATASVDLKIQRAQGSGVSLSLDRAQARPGDEAIISLANSSGERRQVTLAVVDEAARALVPEVSASMDPLGPAWLGALSYWGTPQWSALGDWPRSIGDKQRMGASPFAYPVYDFRDSSEKLDTITVTGSNIRAADIFVRPVASDHSLGQPERGDVVAAATLRTHFAESALWKTDIVLEAGERRSVAFRLPDNLTRWRASAWSASEGDGFGLSEAAIETALPIELRADVPTRVFPGDVTTFSASVRNHADTTVQIDATLKAVGAGIDTAASLRQSIDANADKRISLRARAGRVGEVAVETRAKGGMGIDGVGAAVEVASPIVPQRLPVAGWLPPEGVQLHLPELPAGAARPRIRIQAGRGLLVVANGWVDALRDYPHRCWEQVLSRAVGAAAAKRLGIDARWSDSDRVVRDALETAGQYQSYEGRFHFFVGDLGQVGSPSLYLTAYTVQAFAFLRALGYQIPDDIDKKAREALASALAITGTDSRRYPDEELAIVLAALPLDAKTPAWGIDRLWDKRAHLDWFARANLAEALASREPAAERAQAAREELRDAGKLRGMRRSIDSRPGSSWAFASAAMDQCGVIAALSRVDHAADARQVQREYLRGLLDLYAGGSPNLDTQATAQCLMALVEAGQTESNTPLHIEAKGGAISASVDIAAGQPTAEWVGDVTPLPAQLALRSNAGEDDLVSFVATVEYDADGRHSEAAATAFGIERRYSVLRDRAWKDVSAATIREGDWVRIALRFSNRAVRRYVAITDTVVGGLRPTDLELAGVAGLDLRSLGGDGSSYFSARRIDDRFARFYAEQLPPGMQEVYYYARAAHPGRYAALPAVAELMYGSAGVARTASTVLDVLEGKR